MTQIVPEITILSQKIPKNWKFWSFSRNFERYIRIEYNLRKRYTKLKTTKYTKISRIQIGNFQQHRSRTAQAPGRSLPGYGAPAARRSRASCAAGACAVRAHVALLNASGSRSTTVLQKPGSNMVSARSGSRSTTVFFYKTRVRTWYRRDPDHVRQRFFFTKPGFERVGCQKATAPASGNSR